jgi:NAD(P)H-dependent FMN reductase
MQVSIIVGSHRRVSNSQKVGKYLVNRLIAIDPEIQTYTLDLGLTPLPLWDEDFGKRNDLGVDSNAQNWAKIWNPISTELQKSDALVIISPEWNGMATPAIMNFLLLCKPVDTGHKPALLVAISASRGGAYPISELRASGYKNNYISHIPDHLIIRNADQMLNDFDPESGEKEELYLKKRVDYSLKILLAYAKALKPLREIEGLYDYQTYGNGM